MKGSRLAGGVLVGWFTVCGATLSCGGADDPSLGTPETETDGGLRLGATSGERFGFAPRATAPAPAPATAAPAASAAAGAFDYDLPPGWVERPVTSMRVVNLGLEDEPRAEISLVLLAGDGGGLAENVRRWRAQLGLAPLDAAALDALPEAPLLGRPAARFDAAGAYSGMGTTAQADFRMLGLLAIDPQGSSFLKFTGPADVVAAEEAAFDAFAASLRPADTAPAAAQAPAESAVSGDPERDGLRWSEPDGWRRAPDRQMRTVTYLSGPDGAVECYVAVLGGDGGGVRSNLDRWRGQMGQPPLSAAELDGLERVPSLGSEAVLIEIPGSYRGMAGEEVSDALMLGAVATLTSGGAAERTVFVKLIGPREHAEAEREAFGAFVGSLEAVR